MNNPGSAPDRITGIMPDLLGRGCSMSLGVVSDLCALDYCPVGLPAGLVRVLPSPLQKVLVPYGFSALRTMSPEPDSRFATTSESSHI
jgi:hypothetical protein